MRRRIGCKLLALLLFPQLAGAVEYQCKVERKLDTEHVYTQVQIQKGQFHTRCLVEDEYDDEYDDEDDTHDRAWINSSDHYEILGRVGSACTQAGKFF